MRIWGIIFEEIIVDGEIYWKADIDNPFWEDNKLKIGLNQKFLEKARQRGVKKLILKVGEREIMRDLPAPKEIKAKDKLKEYEERPSLFSGKPPMRIYHFVL